GRRRFTGATWSGRSEPRRVSGVDEVVLARLLGRIIVAACSLQLPADRCASSSRHVAFGKIVSQRFKLLRDIVGQSLNAHPIGYSPHSFGMTVEKGLCFSRLGNLFFDQQFEQ